MEQNGIDASLGLALAIDLLWQRQQTGTLRGTISITQFLRTKQYQCVIQIENGQILSCFLLDEQGQRRPADKEYLIQVDEKGGPFDWKFYPRAEATPTVPSAPVPNRSTAMQVASASGGISPVNDDAIPVRLTPELQFSWLTTWHESEIRFLQQIFSLINGRRTVHDIKTLMFRISPEIIEKSLIFLIAMRQIEMRQTRGK